MSIDDTDFDLDGDILLLEELLNNDPSSSPLLSKELNVEELKTVKSSIDEPPKLKLKELPSYFEYTFLEGADNPWVSLVYCMTKKGGMTVVKNKDNELIPTRWIFGYFRILIDPQDQEKTTFTCPYGTSAYRRMPFGLCNALGTFERFMMEIFHDMIEKTMEVFMDDFSILGDSFSSCLSHLDQMLKSRCSLGATKDQTFLPIHYASKIMMDAQAHYTMTEKELLAVVLENPHQDELEKKKITETFPLETHVEDFQASAPFFIIQSIQSRVKSGDDASSLGTYHLDVSFSGHQYFPTEMIRDLFLVRIDQERIVKRVPTSSHMVLLLQSRSMKRHKLFQLAYDEGVSIDFGATTSTSLKYILNEKGGPKEDACIMSYQSQGVSVWEGAEVVYLQATVFK
nr:reverse transcriptase domain-containing protein [Tanacetum cinerariifolium]